MNGVMVSEKVDRLMAAFDEFHNAKITTSEELIARFKATNRAIDTFVLDCLGPYQDHHEDCAVWAEAECDCGVGWKNDYREEIEGRGDAEGR